MAEVKLGEVAPDFELPLDETKNLKLSNRRGRTVVLYFYPKDDTAGCTTEAKEFNELAAEFAKLNTEVIGVSPDSIKKHKKFKEKHELQLTLLADEQHNVLQAYGVWAEKSMYGRKYMGVERSTFVIDNDGKILHIWRKVSVSGHARSVLDFVKSHNK